MHGATRPPPLRAPAEVTTTTTAAPAATEKEGGRGRGGAGPAPRGARLEPARPARPSALGVRRRRRRRCHHRRRRARPFETGKHARRGLRRPSSHVSHGKAEASPPPRRPPRPPGRAPSPSPAGPRPPPGEEATPPGLTPRRPATRRLGPPPPPRPRPRRFGGLASPPPGSCFLGLAAARAPGRAPSSRGGRGAGSRRARREGSARPPDARPPPAPPAPDGSRAGVEVRRRHGPRGPVRAARSESRLK